MIDYIEILDCISQKEESSVYVVKDKNIGNKLIMREIANSERVYNLYLRLKDIKHPYLPIIYDIQGDGNRLYIIEEYIDGIPVSEMISGGHIFSDEEAKSAALMLCDVLAVLHNRNIVHRDIKPSNIMYTEDTKIKLIDFGAARIYETNQNNDTRYLGTVGYAPPEQYGFCQTDIRADIYSLGITLFEMLTGKLPDSGALYNGKLSDVIQKCIAFDPKNRFENVGILKRQLLNENETNSNSSPIIIKRNILSLAFVSILAFVLLVAGITAFSGKIIKDSEKKALEEQAQRDLKYMQSDYDDVIRYKNDGEYYMALNCLEYMLTKEPTSDAMQKVYDDALNVKRELEEIVDQIKTEKETKCSELISQYVFDGELAVSLAAVYDVSKDVPSLWYYGDVQHSAKGDFYRIIQTSMASNTYLETYYAYSDGSVIVKDETDNRDTSGYTKAVFKLKKK